MAASVTTLTIGQLARASNVGVETIRFYERRGLIPDPPRRASGYRKYPQDTVRRLEFIRRGKKLGFTLAEIADLLSMQHTSGETCARVQGLTKAKLALVEEKLVDLHQIRDTLRSLLVECNAEASIDECPILNALDKSSDT